MQPSIAFFRQQARLTTVTAQATFCVRPREHARELFRRAIACDAECAVAHAGLADCCSYLYLYWQPTVDNLRMADSASRRAVALAPGLAETQVSRAVALSTLRNYPEAEDTFRTAIRIDRNYS